MINNETYMAVYKGDGTSTSFPITFAYAGADTVTGVIEDGNGNLKTYAFCTRSQRLSRSIA